MKTTEHKSVMVCHVVKATIIVDLEEQKRLPEMSDDERNAFFQFKYWKRRYELERSKRLRGSVKASGIDDVEKPAVGMDDGSGAVAVEVDLPLAGADGVCKKSN